MLMFSLDTAQLLGQRSRSVVLVGASVLLVQLVANLLL